MRVYLRAACAFACAWLLVAHLGWLVAPILIGTTLAAAMEPLVRRLAAAGLARPLAVPVAFALAAGLFGLACATAYRLAVAELAELVAGLPARYDRAEALADRWLLWLSESLRGLPASLVAELGRALGLPLVWAEKVGAALLRGAESLVLGGLPRLLLALTVGLALGFFLSRDAAPLRQTLARGLPPAWRPAVREAGERALGLARALLLASLGFAALTFAFVSLALWFLGAPMPVLAGLAAAVLDLLPLFGPGLLFLPWALVLLLLGKAAGSAALLAVWLGLSAFRWWLAAHVATARLGVHPAVVVYALYAGALLFGPTGLVSVPLALIFIRILDEMGALSWERAGGP